MTDGALGQFWLGFLVTVLAQGMGSILIRFDFVRHAGFAVMAGLAFFYFLPVDIGNLLAVRSRAMVTDTAFHPLLMGGMRKYGGFGLGCGVDGRLQSNFCRTFVRSGCKTDGTGHAAAQQESTPHQQSFHVFLLLIFKLLLKNHG
jgi:hypothetical protein